MALVDTEFRKISVISGSFAQFAEWLGSDLTFASLASNRTSQLVIQLITNQPATVQFTMDSGTTWDILTNRSVDGRAIVPLFVDENSQLNFRHIDEETIDVQGFVSLELMCECDD